ncbi:MAG: ABC transporter permease [Phycisphaerales bacterium]
MKKETLPKILKSSAILIGLIVLVVFFAIVTKGQSITLRNLKLILGQSIILMLVSTGVFFVMTLGCMDFSVGANLALSCYVMAKVSTVNIPLGIILTLVTGLIIGCWNGVIHAKLKLPSFLVTLSTMYILNGLVIQLTASEPVPVPFELFKLDEFAFKIPLLFVVLFIAYYLFRYTRFGSDCRMIGAGETAAIYSGIDVDKVKIQAFCIAGVLASLAGFMNGIRTGAASANAGSDMPFNVLIALVIGGLPSGGGAKSRFSAPVIGSILISVLSNGLVLINLAPMVQNLVKGIIFIVLIIIMAEKQMPKFLHKKTIGVLAEEKLSQ